MKLKNLESRRSIRDYTDQKVPESVVNDILTAALYAPTSVNTQPFKLLVLKRGVIDNEKLIRITNQKHALLADFNVFIYTLKRDHVSPAWLEGFLYYMAPAQKAEAIPKIIENFRHNFDLPGSAYAVALAMALEADANNVNSTIYSGFDKNAVAKEFVNDIDQSYELTLAISFGIKSPQAIVYPKKQSPLSDFVIHKT